MLNNCTKDFHKTWNSIMFRITDVSSIYGALFQKRRRLIKKLTIKNENLSNDSKIYIKKILLEFKYEYVSLKVLAEQKNLLIAFVIYICYLLVQPRIVSLDLKNLFPLIWSKFLLNSISISYENWIFLRL